MSLVSLVSAGGFFTTNSTWEALSESIQFQLNDIQNERGFPGGSDGKGSSCNAGDLGSIPRSVGKIPWRREWLPTPGFLPGEFHGQRSLVVGHDWATNTFTLRKEEGKGLAKILLLN